MSKTKSKTKKNPLDNLRPSEYDISKVSSEAKKAGRERKKQAKKMMDLVLEYQNMSVWELEEIMKSKDSLTVLEYTMMSYVSKGFKKDKILLDMIDRHISKAPVINYNENTTVIPSENNLYDEEIEGE